MRKGREIRLTSAPDVVYRTFKTTEDMSIPSFTDPRDPGIYLSLLRSVLIYSLIRGQFDCTSSFKRPEETSR